MTFFENKYNTLLTAICISVCIFFCPLFANAQYRINTFAGTSTGGYSGDGGQATAAQLVQSYGVAVDSAGNVYIGDHFSHVVRKVSTSGIITTFAGTGTTGYSGDGGQATAAQISTPDCVAADRRGNVYIGDLTRAVVRKVDASGVISTYAGNGTPGYSGDGGAATAAMISAANGLATDTAGSLFIADIQNSCIRKVTTSGIITTIAGTGSRGYGGDGGPATAAQLGRPTGVAADIRGNVYITDGDDSRLRKIDTALTISTIAGVGSSGYGGDGGPSTAAALFYPTGVCVDSAGNISIADEGNNRIRQITSSGIINTIAGTGFASFGGDNGPGTLALLNQPASIASGRTSKLYIADRLNHRVRVLDTCTPPVFGPIRGDSTICVGATSVLSDTLGGGTWYSDRSASVSISPTTGSITGGSVGTAHITYTVLNSCASLQAYKSITTVPLPNAGIIVGKDTLCPGDTATFRVVMAGGAGTWSSLNTSVATVSATGLVIGVSGGPGTIKYTYTNSCGTDVSSYNFLVGSASVCNVGVTSVGAGLADYLNIYPNPNTGAFSVSAATKLQSPTEIVISDLLGRNIASYVLTRGATQDISLHVPAGVYILHAAVGSVIFTQKIIVE